MHDERRDPLFAALLHVLPKRVLSRLLGELADLELPRGVRRILFGAYARRYGVRHEELDRPLEDYPSFAEFFGRPLRAGARPFGSDDESDLLAPVDGKLVEAESYGGDSMLVVKGNPHRPSELVHGLPNPERFAAGSQCTLYLAPGDYHRIHMPVGGRLTHWSHVPGALFPVNERSFAAIAGLFARNERVALEIETEKHGAIALVAVGALNVGSIVVPSLPELRSNQAGASIQHGTWPVPPRLARGDEVARFGFGSTVVLLLERPCTWDATLVGTHVRCHRVLGRLGATDAAVTST